MSRPFIASNGTPFHRLAAKRYVKELLREGEYQHPITPWGEPLNATPEYLQGVADRSNAGLAANVAVPLPDGHVDDAKDNTGWVQRFFVAPSETDPSKLSLFGEVDVTDPDYQQKIDDGSISKVSVFLADHGDGQFNPGGDRVVHVALTSYPVASPQGGFVAMSLGGVQTKVPIVVGAEENTPMKLAIPAAKARALGLTVAEGTDDTDRIEYEGDDLIAALEAANTKLSTVSSEAEAAATAAATEKAELETKLAAAQDENAPADIVKALSVDPTKERFYERSYKSLSAQIDAEVAGAVKTGKIHKDVADTVKALLSIDHGYSLAADGQASESDVPELVRKVLASLPNGATVPVSDPTGDNVTIETPKVEGEQLSAKEVEDTAKRMAAYAN